jgi:micrococcal nuclease
VRHLLIACAVAALTSCGATPVVGMQATVTRVVDGDTIVAAQPDGTETKVRVLGLDTPETHKPGTPVQCYGPEATQFARTLLLHQPVTLVPDHTQDALDKYGRSLFYVRLTDGRDYSIEAVKAGMGRSYTYHRPVQEHDVLEAAQAEARAARLGMWGVCGTSDKETT